MISLGNCEAGGWKVQSLPGQQCEFNASFYNKQLNDLYLKAQSKEKRIWGCKILSSNSSTSKIKIKPNHCKVAKYPKKHRR